ncbi:protein FAM180A [Engraulis encrasicolus]|uniref:protein FAM180A n=1 Tax=Engraulis encrasicolus TaxID=184585 RepID=UPI002FCF57EE
MQARRLWFITAWLCLWPKGLKDPRDGSVMLADASPGNHGGLNPQEFVKSVNDANRMYEFLLGGLEMDSDNNIVMLDEELASMRQGRAFLAVFNDKIPKSLPLLEDMALTLEGQKRPLSPTSFETLLLGTVYSAYQARRQQTEKEQHAWMDVLGRLANVTFVELRRASKR